jgi:hypothetical protein
MAKRMVKNDNKQCGKDTGDIIDRLIHDMQNDLQVISMEAHLRLTSKREPRCALDAAEDIERLLGQVRQFFLLPAHAYSQDTTNS